MTRAVPAAIGLTAALLAALPVASAAAAPTGVQVRPDRAVLPVTIELSGGCLGRPAPGGVRYPGEALLTVEGLEDRTVALDGDGTFAGLAVNLPGELPPEERTITLSCDGGETGSVATAVFTALAAPGLELDRVSGPAGAAVTASGTCPRDDDGDRTELEVRFDGEPQVAARLDGTTGEFGPVEFTVPADAGVAAYEVTTSCGGEETFTVVAADAGTGLVPVPDLSGLTEDQVTTVLGTAELVLANPRGNGGRVVDQEPAPGREVPAGSPVFVVLGDPPPGPAWRLVVLVLAGAAGLLVLLAGALALRRRRRVRRERRWLDASVAVRTAGPDPVLSDAPAGPVPGHDIRLNIRLDPEPLPTPGALQEVGDARC